MDDALTTTGIDRLLAVMARLRDPARGCPWDIEQTFETIAPYTIEEAYEVDDAIRRGAWDELEGELGDLLLQTVYHARMAEERGLFDFDRVAEGVALKMIARHPHIWGDESREKSADDQVSDWERVKAAERAGRGEGGALDGVARGLPALMRAEKLGKRAARVGFDWDDAEGVLAKVAEEAREVAEASPDARAEEVGDLLFTVAQLARHLGVDAETALRDANAKFERRFNAMEADLRADGTALPDLGMDAKETAWSRAKAAEATR
ncbi:nucleoside triphosphate pyrophosphohydrolase [Jannaschia sp. Os4]|uniref:nucleoside triphosphate pyrophosphohydrolase n=1 Tax=Jannaschia sp. Os4 TaxID=2807617 RepID=UPI00193939E0|nr:nucleoside triphosphate pyrophosphohydrolase [Jannaschia sp. Os4]MBM2576439.1 nucleoside triphosphate pyrophosphohydrolase [Jannaschia sp. Os4]